MSYIIQYQENSHLFLSLFLTRKKSDKEKTIELPQHSGKTWDLEFSRRPMLIPLKYTDDNDNNHYLLQTYYEPKPD